MKISVYWPSSSLIHETARSQRVTSLEKKRERERGKMWNWGESRDRAGVAAIEIKYGPPFWWQNPPFFVRLCAKIWVKRR